MTQMSRRKLIGGIATGVATLGAGCSGESLGASSDTNAQDDDEFEYIKSTESTVIGQNDTSEPGVIVNLTDFAVSRHSAASEVHIYNEDEVVGQSEISNSKSLTIPVSGNSFDTIRVTDDDGNTLTEYSVS